MQTGPASPEASNACSHLEVDGLALQYAVAATVTAEPRFCLADVVCNRC